MAETTPRNETLAPDKPEDFWAPHPTVKPAELDDAKILQYRHPDERRALLATLAGAAIVGVVLAVYSTQIHAGLRDMLGFLPRGLLAAVLQVLHPDRLIGLVAIVVVVTLLIELYGFYMQKTEIITKAVEITPTTFPQHAPIVDELRRRFAMPPTRVFAYKAPAPEAYSIGLFEPYIIVFPSPLLAQLTMDEFKFTLGREMGRIKLGHTRLAPFIGGGQVGTSGGLADWLRKIRRVFTASFERAQELSCDRMGVLATRNLRPAIDRAIKQGIMPPRGTKVDLEALTKQAQELRHGPIGLASRLRRIQAAEPELIFRMYALTTWAGMPPPPPPPPPPAPAAAPAAAAQPAAGAAPAAPAAAPAANPAQSTTTAAPPAASAEAAPATPAVPPTAAPAAVVPVEPATTPAPIVPASAAASTPAADAARLAAAESPARPEPPAGTIATPGALGEAPRPAGA